MRPQHLSRSQRLALTVVLTVAILLPLLVLFPRYIDWQAEQSSENVGGNQPSL